jgi:hypothetical protein
LHALPRLPSFAEPPIQPHLFVHLGDDTPELDVLAKVLGEAEYAITAYFRGDVGVIGEFLERRGHKVYRQPPQLDEVLPAASHMLSAGDLFTVIAGVAAGRPQLVMPLREETHLNFQMLSQLGVARYVAPTADAQQLSSALFDFTRTHSLLHAARRWAKVVEARTQPGVDAVVAAIRHRASQS